jgi:hypothetical protein
MTGELAGDGLADGTTVAVSVRRDVGAAACDGFRGVGRSYVTSPVRWPDTAAGGVLGCSRTTGCTGSTGATGAPLSWTIGVGATSVCAGAALLRRRAVNAPAAAAPTEIAPTATKIRTLVDIWGFAVLKSKPHAYSAARPQARLGSVRVRKRTTNVTESPQ